MLSLTVKKHLMNKRLLLYSFAAWVISILIFLIISVPYAYDKQLQPLKGFSLLITLVDITAGILAFLIWTGIGAWTRKRVPAWILVTSAVILVMAGIAFLRIPISNEQSLLPPSSQVSLCNRTSPYVMEPRFSRALSLIQERTGGHNVKVKTIWLTTVLPSIINCLDIQYCPAETMGNAEGLFFFSPEIASNERLPICVSKSYQSQDDLITAMLLSHEIVHAVQFALWNAGNKQNIQSCYAKEAEAFTEEFMFMFSTTRGELSSLFSRMATIANLDLQVATVRNLFEIGISPKGIQQMKKCDRIFPNDSVENFTCLYNGFQTIFEEEIRKNPHYRKQCGTGG